METISKNKSLELEENLGEGTACAICYPMENEGHTTGSASMKGIIPILNLLLVTLYRIYLYKVTAGFMGGLKLDCVRIYFVRSIWSHCHYQS